jgi:hypothetical protein
MGSFTTLPTCRFVANLPLSNPSASPRFEEEKVFMVTNPGRVTALRTDLEQHPPSVCCSRLSTLPRSEVATHEFDIFLIPQCLFRV